jgi:hypothetical protein
VIQSSTEPNVKKIAGDFISKMHDPHWPHCLTIMTVGIELEVTNKVQEMAA